MRTSPSLVFGHIVFSFNFKLIFYLPFCSCLFFKSRLTHSKPNLSTSFKLWENQNTKKYRFLTIIGAGLHSSSLMQKKPNEIFAMYCILQPDYFFLREEMVCSSPDQTFRDLRATWTRRPRTTAAPPPASAATASSSSAATRASCTSATNGPLTSGPGKKRRNKPAGVEDFLNRSFSWMKKV